MTSKVPLSFCCSAWGRAVSFPPSGEAAPGAGGRKAPRRRREGGGRPGEGPPMEPEPLRDLRALLAWAGGRQPLRLAGEARPAELETFARDLFAEPPPSPPEDQSLEAAAGRRGTRRARVRSGAGRAPWRGCALLFALLRAASLEQPREKRRLREILRDLRAQLPDAPTPAVVGVVLLRPEPEPEEAAEAEAEAARLQLEGLLRGVFRQRRRTEPGLPDTVQAVAYRPGDGGAAREAACRALRAALKLRADGAGDPPRQKLPAFLSCIPWGRRNEDFHMDEDAIQDLEGAMALTNIAPNGKCEEASEVLDT